MSTVTTHNHDQRGSGLPARVRMARNRQEVLVEVTAPC